MYVLKFCFVAFSFLLFVFMLMCIATNVSSCLHADVTYIVGHRKNKVKYSR